MDLGGRPSLRVDHLQERLSSNQFRHRKRHKDSFCLDFGLPECGHALGESSDHAAAELVDAHCVAQLQTGISLQDLIGNQANLGAGAEIVLVKVAARGNLQVSDLYKFLGCTHKTCVTWSTADLEINRSIIGACGGGDHGQCVPNRIKICEREFVLQNHLAAVPIERDIGEVRADALDARDDIPLACTGYRQHEHQ